jgi:hypothetical protein
MIARARTDNSKLVLVGSADVEGGARRPGEKGAQRFGIGDEPPGRQTLICRAMNGAITSTYRSST